MDRIRLNFVVDRDTRAELEEARAASRSASMTETFRRALCAYRVLLAWKGHDLIARNPETGQETRLYV